MKCDVCRYDCACHLRPPCHGCETHWLCERCDGVMCPEGSAESLAAGLCENCVEAQEAAPQAPPAREEGD